MTCDCPMTWGIIRSNRFKKLYKNKNKKMQEKVDEALRKLVESNDPRTLGRRKYGTLAHCYGHDLDFHNRILYRVDLIENKLHFLRVCSHEEAYGIS